MVVVVVVVVVVIVVVVVVVVVVVIMTRKIWKISGPLRKTGIWMHRPPKQSMKGPAFRFPAPTQRSLGTVLNLNRPNGP